MKNSNSNVRIRTLINELGITQTEFCQKTGITKSALSNYLNGDRVPRQDQISKIADAYGINPAWLMGYDIPMKSDPDMVQKLLFEGKKDQELKRFASYATRFKDLFKAIDDCNDEQIKLITDFANVIKKNNYQDNNKEKEGEK